MADEKSTPKKIELKVDISDDVAQGVYINGSRVLNTQTEFTLDCLYILPQTRRAKVCSRLILSPIHAKILHAALGQNIALHEKKFGSIKLPATGSSGSGPAVH